MTSLLPQRARGLAGLAALALCTSAMSQTAAPLPPTPPPCQAAEQRQFDFWLGRWDVFTPDGKKAGENLIELIEGGCVLQERWRGGGGFTGSSLNSYSRETQQWHQHWVDNQGGLLRLAGALQGPSMVLEGAGPHPRKPGVTQRQRIAWTPLADGAVRQWWQSSDDDGANWVTAFDGRYVRQK